MANIKFELPGEAAVGRDRYATVVYEPDASPFGYAFHFVHLLDEDDGSRELVLLETSIRQPATPDKLDLEHLEPLTSPVVTDLANRFERLAAVARAALEQMFGLETGEENFAPLPVRARREMSDEFLADVLRRHAEFKAQGVPPTQALAHEERVSASTVKHWLRKARAAGEES